VIGHPGEGDARERDKHQRQADAHQDLTRKHPDDPAAGVAETSEQQQPDRRQDETQCHEWLGADPREQAGRDAGSHDDSPTEGQEA